MCSASSATFALTRSHGQAGSSQLDPFNTALSQLLRHLSIRGNELIRDGQRGEKSSSGTLLSLSAQQQGQRANNHGRTFTPACFATSSCSSASSRNSA